VKAIELNGNLQYSWSNKLCLDYDPVILVPNAFSPDHGDELNEKFEVAGGRIKDFQIQIYNRWGHMLFESDDITESWDGKKEGELVPQGLYIYRLRYTNYLDEATRLEGVISVLR
jgi:gliding motility-associated-like protein